MSAFMGLFRRWLDQSEVDDDENNNDQRQSNPSDGSHEDIRRSEMMPSVKIDREELLETEIERLQTELESAKEEAMDLQRQYFEGLATKESESKRLSRELREQIDALNNRLMTERRNFEQLEKKTEVQKTRQQRQLQKQQESNARKLKELQDTITRLNKVTAEQKTELLSLRNEYQRTLNAKEAECNKFNQQLIEVNRRLEDEVKVSEAEEKRRKTAEASLDSQAETKIKHMDEQNKSAVRYQKRMNKLQVTVGQLTRALITEKRRVSEVEEERDQALSSNELIRKRFEKDTTQLNNRLESKIRAQQEEIQAREELQKINANVQKKFLSQRNIAFADEKKMRESLEIQLQEQKEVERLKDNAFEREKKGKEELKLQLQQLKKIESLKDDALQDSIKQLSTYGVDLWFVTKELEREKQIRHDIHDQNKQLMMDRDMLMEKTTEEKNTLLSRITELETEKRKGTNDTKHQNDQSCQRDESQSMELMNAESVDTNTSQVIEEHRNENMQVRNVDNQGRQSVEVEMRLLAQSTQLEEQMRRISELSEALEEEKQKNLELKIQDRHFRSQSEKILKQMLFDQQKDKLDQQMSLEQQKQNTEPTISVTENLIETSTDSQEKVNSDSQVNLTLDDNTKKAVIDAKAETGEDSKTSNRLNQLILDDNKIHELRERMKTLQRLGDKAVTCT